MTYLLMCCQVWIALLYGFCLIENAEAVSVVEVAENLFVMFSFFNINLIRILFFSMLLKMMLLVNEKSLESSQP